nr:hypothetical protein CFP56_60324 [Quercus suber]
MSKSTSAIGATILLWLTITEQLHLSCNIRGNPDCSLVVLALNAKEDYFDDDTEEVPVKGGNDHAITIETIKIDVLDDTENFNGENHQIFTIETDELEDSASITEEECIKSIANVEFLDDVQDELILDEISHSITTEADEQDHLLHNTQDDSKSETITLENNASVEFIDDTQEDVISHGGRTETNAKEVFLYDTQDKSVKTENDHTVTVNQPVSEPSTPENEGAEGIEFDTKSQEENVGRILESNEGTEGIEFHVKSQEEKVGRILETNMP